MKNNSLSAKVKTLLAGQKKTWELLRNNYEQLSQVKARTFTFHDFKIDIQFNPGRIISSSAKVDMRSIQARKCFLCIENLPEVQQKLAFGKDYIILCNPYPIFREHFTIPKLNHIPQEIKGNFEALLDISKELDALTVFYNGPECGASAPDHFHFQAGNKFFMPVENEYENLKHKAGEAWLINERIAVYGISDYLRKFVYLESNNKSSLLKTFNLIYAELEKNAPSGHEPLLNILASFHDKRWRIILFPRGKHRPSQYFDKGSKNILISPAAVDMGGVFIIPQEKDFNKITKENIIDIFRQVSVSDRYFKDLKTAVQKRFSLAC